MTYSVIIPYRDTYNLLIKAVDSIPDREDIQIIIIDNSVVSLEPDAVPRKQYAQVLFLTSDSQAGAGHARNVGLASATGKFILFLDADDYFIENAFKKFDEYADSEYDIIFFNASSEKRDSSVPSCRHKQIDFIVKKAILTGNEDGLRYKFCNPVAKLIRRKLIIDYNIEFQEVPAANDQMFSVWSGHYANKIIAVDSVVYMITEGVRNDSLTMTKSLRNQESRFKVDVFYNNYMKSIGRKDLTCRISTEIIRSFIDFGVSVGLSWVKYAWKNK